MEKWIEEIHEKVKARNKRIDEIDKKLSEVCEEITETGLTAGYDLEFDANNNPVWGLSIGGQQTSVSEQFIRQRQAPQWGAPEDKGRTVREVLIEVIGKINWL